MFDIDLAKQKLKELIDKMEKENMIIIDSINKVYDSLISIDKKYWNSPEKIKMDSNLIPYIRNKSDDLENSFKERINILNSALESYEGVENTLIKDIDKLEA